MKTLTGKHLLEITKIKSEENSHITLNEYKKIKSFML